jgi:hypothetical protein
MQKWEHLEIVINWKENYCRVTHLRPGSEGSRTVKASYPIAVRLAGGPPGREHWDEYWRVLHNAGEEGWELVSVWTETGYDGSTYGEQSRNLMFKRPKPAP